MGFEIIPPNEFFELLYDNEEFCEQLGKLTLASSVLETNLRAYLRSRGVRSIKNNASLGQLVKSLQENNLISKNSDIHFSDMVKKRNYLTHNLYALFSLEIESTIIPRDDLAELDANLLAEKIRNEASDFRFFAESVMEATSKEGAII